MALGVPHSFALSIPESFLVQGGFSPDMLGV